MRVLAGLLVRDLRQAVRSLLRARASLAVALLSIALGVGANVAVFSVVHALLLRQLPYAEPESVVSLFETFPLAEGQRGRGSVSVPNYLDWAATAQSWTALAAWSTSSHTLTGATAGGAPTAVDSVRVTPSLFAVLGRPAQSGRTMGEAEDGPEGARTVVVSHGFWRRRLGEDPAAVGKTIGLDGEPHTLLGVMPADFQFPPHGTAELWVPLQFSPDELASRGSHWLRVIGRLRDGSGLAAARNELETIAARIAAAHPDAQEGRSVELLTLGELFAEGRRGVLLVLWGAVTLVLLIASANVANILLARAAARRGEMAVHAALGAGRAALMRPLFTEALVVAGGGGVAGLAIGALAGRALARLPGSGLPAGFELRLEPQVVVFSLVTTLIAALLSGLPAALRGAAVTPAVSLAGVRAAGDRKREPLKTGLAVVEIGLATLVLVGAGLLVRTVTRLQSTPTGLAPAGVLTAQLRLPPERYDEPGVAAFYGRLLERLEESSVVTDAGLINVLPIQNWGWNGDFRIAGRPAPRPGETFAEFRRASAGYFRALRIPLRAGRQFAAADLAPETRVALVNETLAGRYWPDGDALGQRISFDAAATADAEATWWTIVGIVADVRQSGVHQPARPELYLAAPREGQNAMTVVLRGRGSPDPLAPILRRHVADLDPDLAVRNVQTMEQVIDGQLAGWRFQRSLLLALAAVALALAAAGIYGLLSFSVTERTREIGVRMALGARRREIVRLVVRRGIAIAAGGALAGVLAGLAATRWIRSQLYEVSNADPASYVASCGVVLLVAAVACAVPARRASAVEPLAALREK
jgi:predicted permease